MLLSGQPWSSFRGGAFTSSLNNEHDFQRTSPGSSRRRTCCSCCSTMRPGRCSCLFRGSDLLLRSSDKGVCTGPWHVVLLTEPTRRVLGVCSVRLGAFLARARRELGACSARTRCVLGARSVSYSVRSRRYTRCVLGASAVRAWHVLGACSACTHH